MNDLSKAATQTNADKAKLIIEGYADQLSVQAGDQIGFHISTNAATYAIEIARVGAVREPVWSQANLTGRQYPTPENAPSHGCNWPVALRLLIPEGWQSGYYSAVLRGSEADGRTALGELSFVVRSAHPGRDTTILLQLTTNTDCAYNSWGGATLYSGPEGPARRVSFARPFAGFRLDDGLFLFSVESAFAQTLNEGVISDRLQSEFSAHGIALSPHASMTVEQKDQVWHIHDPGTIYAIRKAGTVLYIYDGFTVWESCWHHWQQPFVSWAERAGFRLDYAVNSDLEFHPEILENYRLVLSVGHDEYWSSPMRDHLETFIAGGGNAAFFSGNSVWWQVRSEDNGRALVCWKDEHEQDPIYKGGNHRLLSTIWCHRLINRPENQLTGVSFAYGGYHRFFDQFQDCAGAYTIHRPEHWVFVGTGVKRGDFLGAQAKIVGYECDGCEFALQDGLPVATHRDGTPVSFEILATAPAGLSAADNSLAIVAEALYGEGSDREHRQPGAAVLGIYTQGGTVFTTGSTDWSEGLRGGDRAVEQITHNILDRLSR